MYPNKKEMIEMELGVICIEAKLIERNYICFK